MEEEMRERLMLQTSMQAFDFGIIWNKERKRNESQPGRFLYYVRLLRRVIQR
jgi:hypothetical protein